MLKKSISKIQWFSLFMLFVGVSVVQLQPVTDKAQSTKSPSLHSQNPVLGLAAVVASSLCSGFAGWCIVRESLLYLIFKRQCNTFWVKLQRGEKNALKSIERKANILTFPLQELCQYTKFNFSHLQYSRTMKMKKDWNLKKKQSIGHCFKGRTELARWAGIVHQIWWSLGTFRS